MNTKTKHGAARIGRVTPEYRIWQGMKKRCYNEKCAAYPYYGARGIIVCSRWIDSFANFLKDVGSRPSPKHTLERIRTEGNYEPGNVVWKTMADQNRNKRNNIYITYNGKTLCVKDWANIIGVSERALRYRLRKWGPERAVSEPIQVNKRR